LRLKLCSAWLNKEGLGECVSLDCFLRRGVSGVRVVFPYDILMSEASRVARIMGEEGGVVVIGAVGVETGVGPG